MELEEKIKDLTRQRLTAQLMATEAYQSYRASMKETNLLRTEWERCRNGYEKVDLELAEIDGRLTKIPTPRPGQNKKKGKTTVQVEPAQMTMDQVRALAQRVGIELKDD